MIPRYSRIKRTRIRRTPKAKERAAMVAEADALTKKLILAERGDHCEHCGAVPVYSAHIKSKGHYQRLRYEKLNLVLLCYRCHIHWAHKEPDDFLQWIESHHPGRLQMLREFAATAAKCDLKLLLIVLRDEVSKL